MSGTRATVVGRAKVRSCVCHGYCSPGSAPASLTVSGRAAVKSSYHRNGNC